MPKFNIDETASTPGPGDYFVGKVKIQAVINDSITKDVEVFLVSSADGARTKVHYHDSDQVLMAAEGQGVLAVQTQVKLGEDGKAPGDLRRRPASEERRLCLHPSFLVALARCPERGELLALPNQATV